MAHPAFRDAWAANRVSDTRTSWRHVSSPVVIVVSEGRPIPPRSTVVLTEDGADLSKAPEERGGLGSIRTPQLQQHDDVGSTSLDQR